MNMNVSLFNFNYFNYNYNEITNLKKFFLNQYSHLEKFEDQFDFIENNQKLFQILVINEIIFKYRKTKKKSSRKCSHDN